MADTISSTPRADGFRMPGEFEPHQGCWMVWPERPDNWRDGARPAQAAFAAVAAAIAEGEPVTVLASGRQFVNARRQLPRHIRVIEATSNDSWCRDIGPSFVSDGKGRLRGIDWGFNAWGGLYYPHDQDELIAAKILEVERVPRYRAPLVLEGGSIHVDGEGTVLTTEECLLNPNRNPHLSRGEIEGYLKDYLNVETVVWLGPGVHQDETDGHIDNLACFVKPGVIALTWTDDTADPQHAISKDAFERLSTAKDARGRPFEVVKLPSPGPLFASADEAAGLDFGGLDDDGALVRGAGHRLAGSYVNFYIGNGIVVMPLLDPRTDDEAREIVARLFPDRRVIAVPGREILLGGGNIHCITQQQPIGRPA
ncbi:agmatine deiminase [Zavarzinia compransoris]|uniref:Putative agmatine deiminase n=1 Tax=Zavarzinia compransoris TaxID=1264899 RepID=A0A317DYG0_9PROT|nr:agmatine deiminase [Zavarzinia compransoris]PWR19778.1 agmatine deiminase [Zavarzinia compransoris]TDP45118.1 agmatine deiminase [Zavarzinia compransoris]